MNNFKSPPLKTIQPSEIYLFKEFSGMWKNLIITDPATYVQNHFYWKFHECVLCFYLFTTGTIGMACCRTFSQKSNLLGLEKFY